MKNLVNHLKKDQIKVIFYRLRRKVFRTIVGVSMNPTLFHNCRTENEVYSLIKVSNENRLKHSTSVCFPFETTDKVDQMSTHCNEFGSRFHWLTQSY